MGNQPYVISTEGEETRFVLPPRLFTVSRVAQGAGYIGVGLACSLLLAYLILRSKVADRDVVGVLWLGMLAWGFAFQGWRTIFVGHGEVLVNPHNDEIRVTHHAGKYATRNILDLSGIARLEIEDHRPRFLFFSAKEASLSAEYAWGERIPIAVNYPRPVLDALAKDMKLLIQTAKEHQHQQTLLPLADVTGIPVATREVLRRPIGSAITEHHAGATHTYVLPRWGVLHTPFRFIAFNILALALASIPILFVRAMLHTPLLNRALGWDTACFLAGVLLAVTALIICAGFHLFLRKAVIVIAPLKGTELAMTYVKKSFWGRLRGRTHGVLWRQSEIVLIYTDVHSAANSFAIASPRDIRLRLWIKARSRRRYMLAEGDELDMRWLATELRRILDVPRASK